MKIKNLLVRPTSMITKEDLQRVDIYYIASEDAHLYINVYINNKRILDKQLIHICSGERYSTVFVPKCNDEAESVWKITDTNENIIAETTLHWQKPREWNFFVMISSHTDIGLHNSQYIQRFNSENFIDKAAELCDKTKDRDFMDQYRYIMEGTWFWNNYSADRGEKAARKIAEEYIKQGKIGVCGGVAGNHTQVYGTEELCRSTYSRRELDDKWGIKTRTMTMIDNNGLSQSIIAPYAEAGFENIIFAPNQWNPLPSTIWKRDTKTIGYMWNPNAGGGGSRIDVSYNSALPMVFYWQTQRKNSKLLVWCSTSYSYGGEAFGMFPHINDYEDNLSVMENAFASQLPKLEKHYPYNVWMLECYDDDQEPEIALVNLIEEWNKKYKWPKIQALGNPDIPFNMLRNNFDKQIPIINGEITGGWYQHPLSAPDLLSEKFQADRALPTAEKLSVLASLFDESFKYPSIEFKHAWEQLLFNDEHSYGTSGYQGRRVYETWMQHRDWINTAKETAQKYTQSALNCIIENINAKRDKLVVFNPTALERDERIEYQGEEFIVHNIPPFGYKSMELPLKINKKLKKKTAVPPIIENKYYLLKFSKTGAIESIYDKQLKRELLRKGLCANEYIYTKDNNESFVSPLTAEFEVLENKHSVTVISRMKETVSGAELIQSVTLPENEKRIEIDNSILHISDMFNKNRYYRYAYYGFPVDVKDCKRYCNTSGGDVLEYAKDITGHGTDVYMPSYEWCAAQNDEFGIAVCHLDSHLVEFDHIHRDKTDYNNAGSGAEIYFYLANDWLQMHVPDGEHLNLRCRYIITSYVGNYEEAQIPQLAERIANPVLHEICKKHTGILSDEKHSFLTLDNNKIRFINLKVAEDGKGLVARFSGNAENFNFSLNIDGGNEIERCSVDERDMNKHCSWIGVATYRIGRNQIRIKTAQENNDKDFSTEIGSNYTGLITEPRAACGEKQGQLYLLWGQNRDIQYYELYRSENPDFKEGKNNFVANVEPGKYCVARYEDVGLKAHTRYYYRVRAVNNKNIRGKISEVFSGLTREKENE